MEQNPKDSSNNRNNSNERKRPKSNVLLALICAIALVLLGGFVYNQIHQSRYIEKTYTDFLKAIEEKQIAKVELRADRIIYQSEEEAAKPDHLQKFCYTGLPSGGNTMELAEELDDMGITVQ